MAWSVELTESSIRFIEEHVSSERVYGRIFECFELLGEYPRMGRAYDPDHPAARPPFPCRQLIVADTPFVIYYDLDDSRELLTVLSIGFAAGNPRARFAGGLGSH